MHVIRVMESILTKFQAVEFRLAMLAERLHYERLVENFRNFTIVVSFSNILSFHRKLRVIYIHVYQRHR